MKHLRNLSARPELVVPLTGDTTPTIVGIPGPFGRERVVTALPLNKTIGPRQLVGAVVMHDSALCYLADPDGNLIGSDAVWVHRMLDARWTQDTRRLAV